MGINNYNDLHDLVGLQFIPVDSAKRPTVKGWQNSTQPFDLSTAAAVGLVCGLPSGNIEALDLDCKYSLDGKLYENYKKLIHTADKDLLKKIVVQKTKNNGYHFIYRCDKIGGNEKIANRYTTDAEKADTYKKTYEAEILKSTDEAKAKDIAKKSSENDKVRVLIETRGIGGQIVCFPSPGYEIVYGDFYSINHITAEERDTLFNIARQFNEVYEEVVVPTRNKIPRTKGISPFEDYNQRGDVVGLLENYGWKIVTQKGKKTVFLRPGQTTSLSSGNFDHDKNWFSVFTTSTEFEPQKAYLPYAVFAYLECNKDFSAASGKLFELGYGEREQKDKPQQQSTRVIPSRVKLDDNDYSFLATGEDYNPYLGQVIDGTLPMGLTTGSPELDKHFLFKEGNMVSINGIDNTGKTKWIWWLQMVAALYHDWKGLIFASENTLGSCMRALIQFYWGKQLAGHFAMSKEEYNIAKDFVEKHFFLIKAQEDLFNYKDILNMAKKARQKIPDLKYCMIDPYNSLKIDMSGFSKLNTHEYHYEAMGELKSYGQQTKFGWFINHHAVTNAARAKDGEKKYPAAPRKEDTEGGVKIPNKTDDFLTIHRLTQHPTDWMVTEVHVRKIKETETGGRPTPLDNPVLFEMYKNGTAFIERSIEGGKCIDPIHSWHNKGSFVPPPPQLNLGGWVPYKDDITF